MRRHATRARGRPRAADLESGQAIGAPLQGVPARQVLPVFMPGGTQLLAGDDGGDAQMWDLREGALVRRACQVAGRRLTRTEWQRLLPGRDYHPAC